MKLASRKPDIERRRARQAITLKACAAAELILMRLEEHAAPPYRFNAGPPTPGIAPEEWSHHIGTVALRIAGGERDLPLRYDPTASQLATSEFQAITLNLRLPRHPNEVLVVFTQPE